MDVLYRWFINASRLGFKIIDAIALASTRFVGYSVGMLWNAANAAYASRAVANFMSQNPYTSLNTILANGAGTQIQPGIIYSQEELVSYFPTLVGAPYNVRATMISENESTGSFKTVSSNVQTSLTWQQIEDRMNRLLDLAGTDETIATRRFYVGWVLGVPILISE